MACYLTLKETFSAAHRLSSPHLTDSENVAVFGACNHIHGHGHNYKLKVTVAGPADGKTGMVMNATDLKAVLRRVLVHVDHRHLDLDVPYFKDCPR